MRLPLTLLAIIALAILASSPLTAQQTTGQITGTVTDSVSHATLPGANVWIEGTGLGTSSDPAGHFTIAKVPAGSYSLNIRYIGYRSRKIPVRISPGSTVELNVVMLPEAVEGETIIVTAQARGQQEAINQQLSSNTIKSVVSSERIHELPDASAAAALSRLPGVSLMNGDQVVIRGMQAKLNTVMINGVDVPSTGMTDRATSLGFISSNLLSGIEVIKALTPDLDANTIGGSVNLRLREAPRDFHFDVYAQGNYNAQDRVTDSYKFWASASDRFLDDKLGVFLQGNADRSDGGQDIARATFQLNGKGSLAYGLAPYQMQNFRFIDQWNVITNSGASAILDYVLPAGKIVLQNTYTSNLSDNTDLTTNLTFDQIQGVNPTIFRDKYGRQLMINALQGDYDFGDIQADMTMSHSFTDKYTRIRYGDAGNPFGFQNTTSPHPYGLNTDGTPVNFLSQRQFLTVDDVMDIPLDPTDVAAAKVGGWIVARSEAFKQHMYTSALNFTIPLTISEDIASKIKFGGKVSRVTRQNDVAALFDGSSDPDYYNATKNFFPNHPGLSPTNPALFTDIWDRDYKRGKYFLESTYPFKYAFNRDLMDDYMRTSESGWQKGPHYPFSTRDDFSGAELFSAGYLMGTFEFGPRLTVIGGARYEHWNMKYHGRFYYCTHEVYGYGVEFDTLNYAERSNNHLFPNAQIHYKFNDWLDLRLAYTKGIARPDYNAIMPSIYYVQGGSGQAGNPDLKPAISTNYDAQVSVYSGDIGLLTVGGFYKRVDNFFFQTPIIYSALAKYNVPFPDSAAWAAQGVLPNGMPTQSARMNVYQNNPNPAHIRGFEVEWQTNFWYLPKPFNSMVLNLNYTRAWSDMDYKQVNNLDSTYTDRSGPRPKVITVFYTQDTVRNARLLYQSDNVLNVALGVDYKGFSGRISFNLQANVISSVGSRPEEDQYTGNIYRWDVTLQQQLPLEGFKIIFDGVNIFHNPIHTYQKFARVPGGPILENEQSIAYSPSLYNLSLRYSF
jgi:TonB-dependent receptor